MFFIYIILPKLPWQSIEINRIDQKNITRYNLGAILAGRLHVFKTEWQIVSFENQSVNK